MFLGTVLPGTRITETTRTAMAGNRPQRTTRSHVGTASFVVNGNLEFRADLLASTLSVNVMRCNGVGHTTARPTAEFTPQKCRSSKKQQQQQQFLGEMKEYMINIYSKRRKRKILTKCWGRPTKTVAYSVRCGPKTQQQR